MIEIKRLNYMEDLFSVQLIPIHKLRPHEKCSKTNFKKCLEKIVSDGIWTNPILVERDTMVIMDGHHRFQIAHHIGLKYIPCIVASYDNPYLKLSAFDYKKSISVNDIINAGLSGNLLDYKSSRHELLIEHAAVKIPIKFLQKIN